MVESGRARGEEMVVIEGVMVAEGAGMVVSVPWLGTVMGDACQKRMQSDGDICLARNEFDDDVGGRAELDGIYTYI